MDAEAPVIAGAASRAAMESRSGPVILTGPGADLLASRMEALFDREMIPEICIDPLCRRGRAGELLRLAKDAFLLNNGFDNVFSGPEYIRPSDAELKSGLDPKTPTGA
jgi:hypothetical protein